MEETVMNGWSRVSKDMVCYKRDGSEEYYNESALRINLSKYLSQESRDRFGDDQFCDLKSYYDGLEWYMDGLALFYIDFYEPNTFNIENAFRHKKERNWPILYVAIDLHGTIIKPGHDRVEFYPYAVEVLKWFNQRPDIKTILWTSSHQQEIDKFIKICQDTGIQFNFINENPMEADTDKACFSRKFYFNILFDDKAGFSGETDWLRIKRTLVTLGEWGNS